jgi:hypothetical protein
MRPRHNGTYGRCALHGVVGVGQRVREEVEQARVLAGLPRAHASRGVVVRRDGVHDHVGGERHVAGGVHRESTQTKQVQKDEGATDTRLFEN